MFRGAITIARNAGIAGLSGRAIRVIVGIVPVIVPGDTSG